MRSLSARTAMTPPLQNWEQSVIVLEDKSFVRWYSACVLFCSALAVPRACILSVVCVPAGDSQGTGFSAKLKVDRFGETLSEVCRWGCPLTDISSTVQLLRMRQAKCLRRPAGKLLVYEPVQDR